MEKNHAFLEKCIERRIERGFKGFIHFLMHLIVGGIVIAAFGYIVMLLWNWLLPDITGWSVVSYWQALGLLVLSRILFGGLGHKHWIGKGRRHQHNLLREKWKNMTDDERKEFLKNRHFGSHGCGYDFSRENTSEKQE